MPLPDGTQPRFTLSPELRRIGEALHAAGGRPVLVGGCVRDLVMARQAAEGPDAAPGPATKDFDLEVFGLGLGEVRAALRRFGRVHSVGRHFGVLKLSTRSAEYDISVPRRESNIGKGHKGFWVKTDPHMSFEEAASRRDFTINAMGYALDEDALLDPYGGLADLQRRLLRHVGAAFGEDPLRVLRAMQFAGRFEYDIVPETLAICREQDLAELPRERLWGELRKLLLRARRPSWGFGYAEALGVLPYFPELARLHAAGGPEDAEGRFRPWSLTMAVLDEAAHLRGRVAEHPAGPPADAAADAPQRAGPASAEDTDDEGDDLALMCAALCHLMPAAASEAPPLGSPGAAAVVEAFLERFTSEAALRKQVLALLADLETPERLHAESRAAGAHAGPRTGAEPHPCDGAVRRLALRVSIPFLLRLGTARHRALHGEAPFVAGAWLEAEAHRLAVWHEAPEPLLKGRHLLEHGLRPGPALGVLLKAAFERQLDGHIRSVDEALAWLAEAHPEVAGVLAGHSPSAGTSAADPRREGA